MRRGERNAILVTERVLKVVLRALADELRLIRQEIHAAAEN